MSETVDQINLDRIGAEFDNQMRTANPFALIKTTFADCTNGPLILALGAVGGGVRATIDRSAGSGAPGIGRPAIRLAGAGDRLGLAPRTGFGD